MNLRIAVVLSGLLAACASTGDDGPKGPFTWPGPPDPPRILFLRSLSACEDLQPKASSWLQDVVVGGGVEEGGRPFGKPSTLAMRGNVYYFTDSETATLFMVDFANKKCEPVPLEGRALLMGPQGLCFDDQGNAYIADRGRKQVVVLDQQFKLVREIGPWDDRTGPTDVAIWQDRLYVCDSGSSCVRVLDRQTGNVLQVLGKKETKDEFTRGPASLAVDDNGFVYVVDTVYSRIYVWDKDGNFVRHIGAPGDAPGHLARPKGVTIFDRMVWVLDSAFDNCQILDFSGRTLMFFGGQGGGPGTMSFPRRVFVSRTGLEFFKEELAKSPDFQPTALIAVTNTWGAKLSFYALGKSTNFQYEDVALPDRPAKPDPAKEAAAEEPAPTVPKGK